MKGKHCGVNKYLYEQFPLCAGVLILYRAEQSTTCIMKSEHKSLDLYLMQD